MTLIKMKKKYLKLKLNQVKRKQNNALPNGRTHRAMKKQNQSGRGFIFYRQMMIRQV